ncbi:MAG: hypothetical protein KC591_05790 [Gemmatimonadetes bacterium]|nr:hypothetical protein [Gemmatimonadota bacterium]
MADPGSLPDPRLEELTQTYRRILGHYQEIVALSREQRRRLAEREPIAGVNRLLQEKKKLLAEIRAEEERVTGAREWWKKVRRNLPPRDGRDLLSLLDAISASVETSLGLESECRELLTRAAAWGGPVQGPVGATVSLGARAHAAYARSESVASRPGDRG